MTYRLLSIIIITLMVTACGQTGKRSSGYQEKDLQKVPENSPEMINVKMGVSYYERGDYDTAIDKLKTALRHNPKLAVAHSAIALVYSNMNAKVDARRHYELSVRYAPNNPSILNNYGTFLCQNGEYQKAVQYYRRTISNPFYKTPETAMENAGVCEMRAERFKQAEQDFRSALKINPNLPVSLYNMVIISAANDQPMNARAFIQRLSSLGQLDEKILKIAYQTEKKLGNSTAANRYLSSLRKIKRGQ